MIELLVPHYGELTYLKECVRSVLAQQDGDWLLHVIDDGSPRDDAAEWLASLGDDRISWERNSRQLGTAGNFQRCVERSRGEHVTLLGNDDLLLPDYVQELRAAWSRHPRAALVQPAVRVVDAHGSPVLPVADRVKRWVGPRLRASDVVLRGEALATRLMLGNWLYFPAMSWRREVLARHGFRQDLPTALDLALLCELALDDHEVVLLPAESFCYRRHALSASSVTAASTSRFVEERQVYAEMAVRFRDRGWRWASRAARLHPTSRMHAALSLVTTGN